VTYLRYPHVHDDLLTFATEDDIYLAQVTGGRAWRLSSDSVAVANPRLSSSASTDDGSFTRSIDA